MAQVLLIEADENLRTILKLNLMKTLGLQIVEKNSAAEAISLLEVLPNIDIVITQDRLAQENTAIEITNYFTNKSLSVPVIILGKNQTKYQQVCVVDTTSSWKATIEMAARVLGMVPAWDENLMVQDFVSIPVAYFLNIHNTSIGCDIYVRVKKEGGVFQYIKRLHSQDYFYREDIEKYVASGLSEFFVTKDSFPRFVNFVTEQLVSKLDQADLTGKERLQLNSESYEITLDRIHSMGIDEATIGFVQESIKSMKSSMKEGGALNNFLQLLQANQLSYFYAHSYFSCLLLHSIVGKFPWNSNQVKDKLTYLAYFHDMSLKEDHLVRINNVNDYNAYEFKSGEREKVLNHALASAQILDHFVEVPLGVSVLIKEHHGVKSGVGFADVLNTAISPVSMMFIVVESFVDEFLKLQGRATREDLEGIFSKLKIIYDKSTYAQTLAALETMTLANK
jgi:CheY-like chemotaxis protein